MGGRLEASKERAVSGQQKASQLGRYGHDPEVVPSCARVCGRRCAFVSMLFVLRNDNQTEEHSRAAKTISESVPQTLCSPFPPCTATSGPVAWWVPRFSFFLHSKAPVCVWAYLPFPVLTTKVREDEAKALTWPSLESHPPHPA